jgi:hypothetical protein
LDEAEVDDIAEGYEESALAPRAKLAVAFADAFLAAEPPPAETIEALLEEFTPEETAEMAVGLALFHGFSKFLIVTGCEPESMPTTVLAAPGAPPAT